MSCKLHPAIEKYLINVETNTPRACPEQHALAAHIRRCFSVEDIRVDERQLEKYLGLVRYFPYEALFPWE